MSRIGKQKIALPQGTTATVDGLTVTVKGPLGELTRTFTPQIVIHLSPEEGLSVTPVKESQEVSAIWGTTAAHLANMVAGVNKAYVKKLILEGVGYRVELKGTQLVMQLGFSHPVLLDIPKGITATVDKNNITISGFDKELVGQFAALIRDQKKPEPYKGKGMRYDDEIIRRKEGKRAA
ncbi:MAG: 50S ribosomal protein L6 [Patescibacteria group bacterium]